MSDIVRTELYKSYAIRWLLNCIRCTLYTVHCTLYIMQSLYNIKRIPYTRGHTYQLGLLCGYRYRYSFYYQFTFISPGRCYYVFAMLFQYVESTSVDAILCRHTHTHTHTHIHTPTHTYTDTHRHIHTHSHTHSHTHELW